MPAIVYFLIVLIKRLRMLLVLAPVLALLVATPAQAHCGFGCLHRQIEAIRKQTLPVRVLHLEERLSADEKRLEAQDTYISWLEERATKAEDKLSKVQATLKCFGEVPLTRYGEELGPSGYLFRLEGPNALTLATTALDVTYPGDAVGAWVFANTCRTEDPTPVSATVRQGLVPAARFDEFETLGSALRWRTGR